MHRIALLLTAIACAFAEGGPTSPVAPPGGGPGPGAAPGGSIINPGTIMLVGLAVMMVWMLFIRPQGEEKRRKAMLDAIKRGDDVVTIGGVHGTVESVGEATIDVRLGKGDNSTVVTFNKGAISTNLTNERAAKAAGKK